MSKTQNSIFKTRLTWLGNLAVFVLFFILYSRGVPKGLIGLLHSDLFVWAGSQGGVLPPPGYPVYTWLLNLSSNLSLLGASIPQRTHMLSAVFGAASLSLVFATCNQLYNTLTQRQKKSFTFVSPEIEQVFLSFSITLLVGFSAVFWRSHLLTERFSFSHLLLAASLYLMVKVFKDFHLKQSNGDLVFLSFLLGLGLTHQWIFIGPSIITAYFVYNNISSIRPQIRLFSLVSLLMPIGLYYLLLTRLNINSPTYSWIIGPSVSDLVNYFNQGYWGDGVARSANLPSLLQSLDIKTAVNNIWQMMITISQSMHWGIWGLLIVANFYGLTTKEKWFLKMMALINGVLVVLLAIVIDWKVDISQRDLVVYEYGILHIPLGIMAWFGLWELTHRLGTSIKVLVSDKKYHIFIPLGLMILILASIYLPFAKRHQFVSLRDKDFVTQAFGQLYETAEDNALVGCFSLESCYSLIASQAINRIRTDITIVPYYYQPNRIKLDVSELIGFAYSDIPWIMFDILTWNRDLRPVYVVDMFDPYTKLLGIDAGYTKNIPYLYFNLLSDQLPEEYPPLDISPSANLRDIKVAYWDVSLQKAAYNFSRMHMITGSVYLLSDRRDLTTPQMNLATNLAQTLPEQFTQGIVTLRGDVEGTPPSTAYALNSQTPIVSDIVDEVKESIENDASNKAFQQAQGAVVIDPRNVEARILWAEQYARLGASESAVLELNNALTLEPDNQKAKDLLSFLSELGF